MSAPTDVQALFDAGRYHDVLRTLKPNSDKLNLSGSDQVLLAQALTNVGEWDSAQKLSQRILAGGKLTLRQRCRTHGTLARCYFRAASSAKGTDEFRNAIQLAEKSNDSVEECWLRLQLFLNQVQWLGP